MNSRLIAIVRGAQMGELIYDEKKDRLSFHYDPGWVETSDAFPLSVSLPIVKPEHADAAVRPFISGLLPDNTGVLEQWGRRFQVSPRNPFRLLQHVGEECAGAVQFVNPENAETWLRGNAPRKITWLSETDLQERVAELVADHSAARRAGDRGQFSLAGAQPKMGLYWDEKKHRWGVPEGETPTTHILKPNVGHFADYDQNEHFCLTLARRLGLNAGRSHIRTIGSIPVIVVERFDRIPLNGKIVRIHQEDICQALAIMPDRKYESEGGPSAARTFRLIRDYSSRPADDQLRFLDALIYNWLIKGTDAHAKNYGFLIAGGGQIRLAPLYDLSSLHAYEKRGEERRTRMAMKIGGEYPYWKIGPRQWEKAASEWKLDPGFVSGRIRKMAHDLPDAIPAVKKELQTHLGKTGAMLRRLAAGIQQQTETAAKLFAES